MPRARAIIFQRNLVSPVVGLTESIHFLLFLPCICALKQLDWVVLHIEQDDHTDLASLQKLNVVVPYITTVLVLTNAVEGKFVGLTNTIACGRRVVGSSVSGLLKRVKERQIRSTNLT
jgi:hypothetical protein